jgi:hypothetical protein
MSDNFVEKDDFYKTQTRLYTQMLCVSNHSKRTADADNNFRVDFPRFTKVTKIELMSVEIPNRLYDIDATSNAIDFTITSTTYAATVPAGIYNGTELAVAMNVAMDALSVPGFVTGTVIVSFDKATNKFTFTVTGETLTIHAGTGATAATGIWAAIGFNATDVTTTTIAIAQNTSQLREGENFVYLSLANLGSIESTDGETDVFAKVITDDLVRFNSYVCTPKTYSIASPLPSLSTIHTRVVRRDGTLYNLRDTPMSYTLQITYVQ